jgi:hypothetical protein
MGIEKSWRRLQSALNSRAPMFYLSMFGLLIEMARQNTSSLADLVLITKAFNVFAFTRGRQRRAKLTEIRDL